jgi:hypothetical protein
MAHADAAKLQVGFGRVWYLWPTFAGRNFHCLEGREELSNDSHPATKCGLIHYSSAYLTSQEIPFVNLFKSTKFVIHPTATTQ